MPLPGSDERAGDFLEVVVPSSPPRLCRRGLSPFEGCGKHFVWSPLDFARRWEYSRHVRRVALVTGGGAPSPRRSGAGRARTAPSNTSPPTISGSATVGSTLTASSRARGAAPTRRPSATAGSDAIRAAATAANIGGAKRQTYKVGKGDAGRTLRVSVTANNSDGSANAVSAPTAVVCGRRPVNTSPPTVAGTAKEGETLTATSGTWSGSGPISFTYQWRRCDAGGGTTATAPRPARPARSAPSDVGHTIRVEVRGEEPVRLDGGDVGRRPASSRRRARSRPSSAPPVISGFAREGQVLTAAPGTWANAPTSFQYNWRRCDVNGNNCDGFANGPQVKLAVRRRRPPDPRRGRGEERVRDDEVDLGADCGRRAATPTAPSGAIKLPSGETSLPVSMIASPQRLVISGIHSRRRASSGARRSSAGSA